MPQFFDGSRARRRRGSRPALTARQSPAYKAMPMRFTGGAAAGHTGQPSISRRAAPALPIAFRGGMAVTAKMAPPPDDLAPATFSLFARNARPSDAFNHSIGRRR